MEQTHNKGIKRRADELQAGTNAVEATHTTTRIRRANIEQPGALALLHCPGGAEKQEATPAADPEGTSTEDPLGADVYASAPQELAKDSSEDGSDLLDNLYRDISRVARTYGQELPPLPSASVSAASQAAMARKACKKARISALNTRLQPYRHLQAPRPTSSSSADLESTQTPAYDDRVPSPSESERYPDIIIVGMDGVLSWRSSGTTRLTDA